MANPNAKLIPVNLAGTINLNKYKADVDTTYSVFNKKNAPIFGGVLSPLQKAKRKVKDYSSSSTHEAFVSETGDLYADGKKLQSGIKTYFDKRTIEGNYLSYFNYFLNVAPSETEDGVAILRMNNSTKNIDIPENAIISLYSYGSTRCAVIEGIYGGFGPHTYIYYFDESSMSIKEILADADPGKFSVVIAKEKKSGSVMISFLEKGKSSSASSIVPKSELYVFDDGGVPHKATIEYAVAPGKNITNIKMFSTLSKDGTLMFLGFATIQEVNNAISNGSLWTVDSNVQYTSPVKVTATVSNTPAQIAAFSSEENVNEYGWKVSDSYRFPQVQTYIYNASTDTQRGFYYVGNGEFYRDGEVSFYAKGEDSADRKFFTKPGGISLDFLDSKFRALLSTNGDIRGISLFANSNDRGTLLTPWNSISQDKDIIIKPGGIVYFDDIDKKWTTVGFSSYRDKDINTLEIFGDYIVIQSPDFPYCINAVTGAKYLFSDDWNNRIFDLINIYEDVTNQGSVYSTKYSRTPKSVVNEVVLSSAVNAQYPSTRIPVASSILPGEVCYTSKAKDSKLVSSLQSCEGPMSVDVYIDNKYSTSSSSRVPYREPNLLVTSPVDSKKFLTYPIGEAYYNIAMPFERIESVTNQDLVKFKSTAYSLLYFNNSIVFLYTTFSQMNSITDAFVIQGTSFGIIDNRIVQYSLQNNKVAGSSSILSIEGMQYLSASPYEALFWSPTNRTLYSFTGDNVLTPKMQADSITEISSATYNPATGSIAVSSNTGSFIMNPVTGMFLVEDLKLERVSSHKNGFSFLSSESPSTVTVVGYSPFQVVSSQSGNVTKVVSSEPQYTELETEFFGAGNNIVSETDCWYIRLSDEKRSRKKVTVSCKTLTDKGEATEEKSVIVNPVDWDKETDTFYLRFQPKLQRGVGSSFKIVTNASIASIVVGTRPDTTQLSYTNI